MARAPKPASDAAPETTEGEPIAQVAEQGAPSPPPVPEVVRAAYAVRAIHAISAIAGDPDEALYRVTVAILVFHNGDVSVGHHAAAIGDEFDPEQSAKLAQADAMARVVR